LMMQSIEVVDLMTLRSFVINISNMVYFTNKSFFIHRV
jgi:hypothetical protein